MTAKVTKNTNTRIDSEKVRILQERYICIGSEVLQLVDRESCNISDKVDDSQCCDNGGRRKWPFHIRQIRWLIEFLYGVFPEHEKY